MKKTPVMMTFEDGAMKIEHWETGEVLWWMKTGGSIKYYDARKAAEATIKARGYEFVDSP